MPLCKKVFDGEVVWRVADGGEIIYGYISTVRDRWRESLASHHSRIWESLSCHELCRILYRFYNVIAMLQHIFVIIARRLQNVHSFLLLLVVVLLWAMHTVKDTRALSRLV